MTPPATATARSAARTAPGTRRTPVRHPRRISGPASPGIALRTVGALDGISAGALFDRLIRGRAWIGLLAFALIGMVAMQLLVLKLNTGIGHTLEHVAQLQRANAQLGIENSTASAESRIAPSAATAGMTLAPVGTVHFVAASRADVSRAASALAAPIQASAGTQSTEGSPPTEGSQSTEASSGASESGASESSATEAGETATSSASGSPSTAVGGETASSPEGSAASSPASSPASSSLGSGAAQGSAATAETGGSAASSGSGG